MRRDHRPYWLKHAMDQMNRRFVDYYCRPQFESAGIDLRMIMPRQVQISGPNITAGDHVHFWATRDAPIRVSVFEGLGHIHLGDHCIINPGVRITSASRITLGAGCMLAMNAYLADADWHDLQHRIYAPGATAPIVLEDNVWIGDGALVTKGVTIGANSIVGARSVVTADVPPDTIVAGIPARPVRNLDPHNRTTRSALFSTPTAYDTFEAAHFRQQLAGNTLFGWLKSVIAPGARD